MLRPVNANLRDRVPRRGLAHDPAALRYALGKSGLTQRELATAIGRSKGLVSEMLAGSRNVTAAMLPRIAAVLNCPVVVLEAKRSRS